MGLDIESGDRTLRKDPLALARRYFSAGEVAALEGVRHVRPRRGSCALGLDSAQGSAMHTYATT